MYPHTKSIIECVCVCFSFGPNSSIWIASILDYNLHFSLYLFLHLLLLLLLEISTSHFWVICFILKNVMMLMLSLFFDCKYYAFVIYYGYYGFRFVYHYYCFVCFFIVITISSFIRLFIFFLSSNFVFLFRLVLVLPKHIMFIPFCSLNNLSRLIFPSWLARPSLLCLCLCITDYS